MSLALWRETQFGNIDIINEDEVNPSARYMIYMPMDSEYNLLEFDAYSVATHGDIQYSNITSLNFLLYHYESNLYSLATHDDIVAGTDLYVYSNDAVYDPLLHGNKVYYALTDLDYQLYYYSESTYVEADSAVVTQMMIDASDTLAAGMFYVYPEETYIDIFSTSDYGQLYCSSITTTGYQLYYIENQTKTIATPEQIAAGINLYVNEYAVYDQLEHGIFMLNSYTSGNYYIYYYNGEDYIEPTQSMLTTGTDLYVNQETIISYAVVGYTGIIPDVVIPTTYTPEGSSKTYYIMRVCSYSGAMDYTFNGNALITSLIIPNSVVSIADAVFADMVNLQRVELSGAFETITIGDYAFLGCYNLATFIANRTMRDKYDASVDYTHNAFTGCVLLQ